MLIYDLCLIFFLGYLCGMLHGQSVTKRIYEKAMRDVASGRAR